MANKATVRRGRKNTEKTAEQDLNAALGTAGENSAEVNDAPEHRADAASADTPLLTEDAEVTPIRVVTRTEKERDRDRERDNDRARDKDEEPSVKQDTMRIPAYLLEGVSDKEEAAEAAPVREEKRPSREKASASVKTRSRRQKKTRTPAEDDTYKQQVTQPARDRQQATQPARDKQQVSQPAKERRRQQDAPKKSAQRQLREDEPRQAKRHREDEPRQTKRRREDEAHRVQSRREEEALQYQRQLEEEALERARERERQLAIEAEQERLRLQRLARKKDAEEERRKKREEEARIRAEVERRVREAELTAEPKVIVSPRVARQRKLTIAWVSAGVVILAMISVFIGIRYDRIRRELDAASRMETTAESDVGEEHVEGGDSAAYGETEGSVSRMSMSDGIRRVYLTFDDGPSAVTEEILDILAQYHVKATFFVLGRDDEQSIAIYKRIVDEGHTLAMHSYTHDLTGIYASLDAFQEDLHRLQNLLYDATGEWCTIYRFPGGSSTTSARVDMEDLIAYLGREHIVYYDWNVYGGDNIAPETIIANVRSNVEKYDNAVVLMHDGADKEETAEALPEIIEYIQSLEDTVILPITEETVPVQHGLTP